MLVNQLKIYSYTWKPQVCKTTWTSWESEEAQGQSPCILSSNLDKLTTWGAFFCLFIWVWVGGRLFLSFFPSFMGGREVVRGQYHIICFTLKEKNVLPPPLQKLHYLGPAYFIEVNDPCTIPCMDREVQLLTTKVAEDQHVHWMLTHIMCNGQELVPTSLHAKWAKGDIFLHLINALKDKKWSTLNNGLGHGLWNLIVPQLLDETMGKANDEPWPKKSLCSSSFF